ncbi:MAG TPA: EamA family transporter [Rhizomicrobium sp.]|nr:EamA family transporter [Rhizomicrobium sp.]
MKILPVRHILLALAVVAVWGSNFTVAKLGLRELPPLFFTFLRFFFAFLPAAFFIRRPPVPWRLLAAYGVLIGGVQFGFLYIALENDISPGLASLVVQSQVFITIGLSIVHTGEHVKPFQWAALALAVVGLGIIVAHGGQDATPLGVGLVLVAAAGWAAGNHISRLSGKVDMLGYVVWSSVFALPPLLLLSLLFDGLPAIATGVAQASAVTWASVAYQSLANTMFGYAVWGWLLARYPAATVAPLSLLVPIFGFSTSALVLGESLPAWKLGAGALVLGGLAINILWPRIKIAMAPPVS